MRESYHLATVSFLNCLPLVDWFATPEGRARATLTAALPSLLAPLLADGRADAALLPTAEILRARAAGLVGSSGIACYGPVDSVKLYYRGPLGGLRRVAVDRGSRTSVALLHVLLAETVGAVPPFLEVEPRPGALPAPDEGVLVIGDRCFAFDRWLSQDAEAAATLQALDLGQAWLDLTDLPFVFAAWAAAPDLAGRVGEAGVRELDALLVRARDHGLARLPELAAREAAAGALGPGGWQTAAALESYFRRSLRYPLGPAELDGIRRFHELGVRHGLLPPEPGLRVL
ncbi:MAG: hypothetical protein IPK64_14300 [bacterium]|nr:hypothetical protein [bacterium]